MDFVSYGTIQYSLNQITSFLDESIADKKKMEVKKTSQTKPMMYKAKIFTFGKSSSRLCIESDNQSKHWYENASATNPTHSSKCRSQKSNHRRQHNSPTELQILHRKPNISIKKTAYPVLNFPINMQRKGK